MGVGGAWVRPSVGTKVARGAHGGSGRSSKGMNVFWHRPQSFPANAWMGISNRNSRRAPVCKPERRARDFYHVIHSCSFHLNNEKKKKEQPLTTLSSATWLNSSGCYGQGEWVLM